ncbi:argonaute-like protein [Russula brevipes]|nr:argonaute-like protein [Russula brevipes]
MLSKWSQKPSLARQDILAAAHDQAIGVGRPGYGTEGRQIKLFSNHVEVKFDHGMIYHYDGIYLEMRSIAQNFKVIHALQTQVEGRLSVQPGVYDGRKNLFTSFDLGFESGAREYIVPLGHPSDRGAQSTEEFTVRLTYVTSINPEVLQRFLKGEQRHDNEGLTAIMALNVVIRTEPSLRYPSKGRSFFTNHDTRPIGGGIHLWRGYFQSLRPSISRMLINVDISTVVMYRPGRLIDLALEFVGNSGRPNALAPRLGFPDRERLRLQHFITGLKVTTPYRSRERDRRRLIKKVTREGARDRTFEIGDGQIMKVAEYFQDQLNIPLQFPDMACVELSTGAVIPLELCEVPPGQVARKQLSPDEVHEVLRFSMMRPPERMKSVVDGLNVLQYGQSEYVRQFGMSISDKLVNVDARIIKPPRLIYNSASRQPNVQPRNGTWNLIDKLMYRPAMFPNWMVIIYERQHRFNSNAANEMIRGFVHGCDAVGRAIQSCPIATGRNELLTLSMADPPQQLRAACEECQRKARAPPSLIVAVIPDGGNDIYTAIKHFGDVTAGIPTQCMKAAKCYPARPQYYANIALKVNMKLGGTNVVPEPQNIFFLTDPANPTMVMGGDITHPPSGTRGRPSFSSITGSVDTHATRYVSRLGVQVTHRELIDGIEDMCLLLNMLQAVFEEYRKANNQLPKRILFYRDGVSEGEFKAIIDVELRLVRNACATLRFNPTITLVVVGKGHKTVFFPARTADADSTGNCPAGTVVDTGVVDPVKFDYYLYGHAGLLGTSRPAHYTVLVDENNLTPDDLQSLSFALCHVYAPCTRSVSVPAPVYYAHNVCLRAKNHYDPQQGRQLFGSEIASASADWIENEETDFQKGFQRAHERMSNTMYFC